MQVKKRFLSKSFIFSLSIILMLPCTTHSQPNNNQNPIKSATYLSEKFELGPGQVLAKSIQDIEFPRGHIGVKSFDVDLVDEQGNSVPLYETYIHHWFAIRYHINMDKNMSHDLKDHSKPFAHPEYIRNDGTCNTYILPHYWGLGSESRGTSSKLPDPFAVELGNPANIKEGWEEKWLFSIMVLDTRGTEDRKSCSECRCDQFNLPENFYNVTTDIHGNPLSPEYEGGIFCCQNFFQCKLRNGFQAPCRKLALRYTITWVDWDLHQIPVRFYILDSTDRITINGSEIIHDCQVNKLFKLFCIFRRE